MEGNAENEGLSLGLANFRTGSGLLMKHVWYNEALSQRANVSTQNDCHFR